MYGGGGGLWPVGARYEVPLSRGVCVGGEAVGVQVRGAAHVWGGGGCCNVCVCVGGGGGRGECCNVCGEVGGLRCFLWVGGVGGVTFCNSCCPCCTAEVGS